MNIKEHLDGCFRTYTPQVEEVWRRMGISNPHVKKVLLESLKEAYFEGATAGVQFASKLIVESHQVDIKRRKLAEQGKL